MKSCVSYSISRVHLDESNGEDDKDNVLDIWLREGPGKPDIVISLADLYSVRPLDRELDSAPFIDEVSLVHLPKSPMSWPAEAVGRLERYEDLPELAWLRITGPIEVDALAAIVTVYQAMSDDEASVLRPN